MTVVEIDDSQLVVHIQGVHQMLAFKRTIVTPLDHVVSATPDPDVSSTLTGLRAPGAYVPGVITAGTYRSKSGKEFWDVGRNPSRILVIELKNSEFERLVIDVENPAAISRQIETALMRRLQPNT